MLMSLLKWFTIYIRRNRNPNNCGLYRALHMLSLIKRTLKLIRKKSELFWNVTIRRNIFEKK